MAPSGSPLTSCRLQYAHPVQLIQGEFGFHLTRGVLPGISGGWDFAARFYFRPKYVIFPIPVTKDVSPIDPRMRGTQTSQHFRPDPKLHILFQTRFLPHFVCLGTSLNSHPGSRGPLKYCRREYQSLRWFRRQASSLPRWRGFASLLAHFARKKK